MKTIEFYALLDNANTVEDPFFKLKLEKQFIEYRLGKK